MKSVFLASLLLVLGLVVAPGCGAAKTGPEIVAIGGDQVVQSIGALQKAVTGLESAKVLTPELALKAQLILLNANARAGELPPILRAIDAGQSVDGTQLDKALGIVQNVTASLAGLGIGWPDRPEVQKILELVRGTQQLISTVTVQIAQAKRGPS